MFFDIGVGFIISALICRIQGDCSHWLIVSGGVVAVAPDLDTVIYRMRGGKMDHFAHEHRDIFHYPIPFVLGGVLLAGLMSGPVLASVWFAATMFHFLKDTISGGWGIKWGWPFLGWYLTLAPYSPKYIFKTKDEQRRAAALYGDPEWFKKATSPWNILAGIAFAVFSALFSFWIT